MLFNANVKFQGYPVAELPTQDEIRHIPQFFRSDADYVYRLGGPFLRKFIGSLPLNKTNRFKYLSIDARVHMLKPSWYPCPTGWHCDDFYRPTGQQPDLNNLVQDGHYSIHHAMFVGPCSRTQFILLPFEQRVPSAEQLGNRNLYDWFNEKIEQRKLDLMLYDDTFASSGELVTFNCFDFHRCTAAERDGWRLFVRATETNHYVPQNEIRTQTQVYLKDLGAGW